MLPVFRPRTLAVFFPSCLKSSHQHILVVTAPQYMQNLTWCDPSIPGLEAESPAYSSAWHLSGLPLPSRGAMFNTDTEVTLQSLHTSSQNPNGSSSHFKQMAKYNLQCAQGLASVSSLTSTASLLPSYFPSALLDSLLTSSLESFILALPSMWEMFSPGCWLSGSFPPLLRDVAPMKAFNEASLGILFNTAALPGPAVASPPLTHCLCSVQHLTHHVLQFIVCLYPPSPTPECGLSENEKYTRLVYY